MHNLAVTFTLTPVLQKVGKIANFQEIGGCLSCLLLLQNSVLVESISYKSNFVRFGTFLVRGRKWMPNFPGTIYPFGVKYTCQQKKRTTLNRLVTIVDG